MDELVVQTAEVFGMASRQHLRAGQEIDRPTDVRVSLIPLLRDVVPRSVAVDNLIGGLAEDVDIVLADLLRDLDVRAVHRTERERAVQHELHVAGTGRLLRREADLLREVAGRNQLLRRGHVVVLDENDLQPLRHDRIRRDHLRQHEQRMDDILRDDVRRGRLRAEDADERGRRQMARLDLMVLVDEVEQVQLLPLVLVETLRLDVEHRARVHRHALGPAEPVGQCLLILALHFAELFQHRCVIRESHQLLELGRILAEARADVLLEHRREARIALQEPATEGDAVRLVIKLLRVEFVEVMELRVLQDLRMQRGDTIRGMREMDVHMCHVDDIVLVDDGERRIFRAGPCQRVELLDDRHQLRNDRVEVRARPLFKCLRKNRMIRISAGLRHNLDRLLEVDAVLAEQADELRDDHARVRVVDLDRRVVREIMVVTATCCALLEDQLRTGGHHQILLVDTETTAGLVGIVRVEEQRQVLVDGGLVEGDAVMDDALVDGIEVEEVQGVRAALVAGHRELIEACGIRLACELHRIGHVGLLRPAVRGQPWVRLFVLDIPLEGLVEQAEVVAEANAVARQVQCRKRIQEAGCETAEAAVAEGWLRLDFLDVGHALSDRRQRVAHLVVQPEVDEVI